MGYRNYIGVMPKEKYNKIKSMNRLDVLEEYNAKEDGYIGVYDFGKELYNFGKYVEFSPPKECISEFFLNNETQTSFADQCELNIVTKEFLRYIISYYTDIIKAYYNKMVIPFFGSYDREKPTSFLNSIKSEIKDNGDRIYKCDFSLITDVEQQAILDMIQHIRSMRMEWNLTPYNLNEGDEVTHSWKYEYSIFELVRIYKQFDWENNVMIYYGY